MRVHRRKAIAAVAGLTAGTLLLSACSSGGPADDGPTEITFRYLWTGHEGEFFEELIDEFNASQDEIVVTGVMNPDTQSQLAAMTASEGSFDISDHFGTEVAAWASRGVIEPLDQFAEEDGYDFSNFLPEAMEQMTYEGQVYSMPISVATYLLLYNEAVYEENGLTAPETIEEWGEQIQQLNATDDSGNVTRLGWANPDLTTLAYAFGGGWSDEEGRPTPNLPENVAAAQFYVDNVLSPNGVEAVSRFTSGFGDYQSPQNPFYQGNIVTTTDGAWQSRFISDYAPEMEWNAVPIPYPEDRPELAGSTQMTISTLFIPRNSQHKEEAWEFMKFLLSRDVMLETTLAMTAQPSRIDLIGDPAYADLPMIQPWIDSLDSDNINVMAATTYHSRYAADLGEAFDAITSGRLTPQEAFDAVAEKTESYQ